MPFLPRLPHISLTEPRAASRGRHEAEIVSRREVRSNSEQCLGRGPRQGGKLPRQTQTPRRGDFRQQLEALVILMQTNRKGETENAKSR